MQIFIISAKLQERFLFKFKDNFIISIKDD